jgi:hypothetical protein
MGPPDRRHAAAPNLGINHVPVRGGATHRTVPVIGQSGSAAIAPHNTPSAPSAIRR